MVGRSGLIFCMPSSFLLNNFINNRLTTCLIKYLLHWQSLWIFSCVNTWLSPFEHSNFSWRPNVRSAVRHVLLELNVQNLDSGLHTASPTDCIQPHLLIAYSLNYWLHTASPTDSVYPLNQLIYYRFITGCACYFVTKATTNQLHRTESLRNEYSSSKLRNALPLTEPVLHYSFHTSTQLAPVLSQRIFPLSCAGARPCSNWNAPPHWIFAARLELFSFHCRYPYYAY
jgi:hypothetical protein